MEFSSVLAFCDRVSVCCYLQHLHSVYTDMMGGDDRTDLILPVAAPILSSRIVFLTLFVTLSITYSCLVYFISMLMTQVVVVVALVWFIIAE